MYMTIRAASSLLLNVNRILYGLITWGNKEHLVISTFICFKGNISLLESIKNNETVRVMFVAQDSEGLVSTRSFRKGEPVVFVCGRLCLPSECPGREKPGSITPFVILYT